MKKYTLLSIVGARPQFIKAAALSQAFERSGRIHEVMVHSGQHYDAVLSSDIFEELGMSPPQYNLEIGSTSHNEFIGRFLIAFQEILISEKPDIVLVYGDTNTTSAGAIAAAKNNIPLVHVEAGLREFDKSIPEEVNKLLTDAVTDLFFTPTDTGRVNLENEGKTDNVWVTGDISLDLLFDAPEIMDKAAVASRYGVDDTYIFCTCHRQANTDIRENLVAIVAALNQMKDPVILSLHPRTKAALQRHGLADALQDHIKCVPPLPFWDTQALVKHAELVLTDSGGIIKEAYFHKTPCVIIDKQTEWVEAVEEGWTHIAGPDTEKICTIVDTISVPTLHTMALGDGNSGNRITKEILRYLDTQE